MLFMNIVTWEPEKRDEVLKRALEEKVPEGIKVIGNWGDFSGRSFRLTETDDPTAMAQSAMYWNDVCEIEVIPVMEVTEEALKSFAAQ